MTFAMLFHNIQKAMQANWLYALFLDKLPIAKAFKDLKVILSISDMAYHISYYILQ